MDPDVYTEHPPFYCRSRPYHCPRSTPPVRTGLGVRLGLGGGWLPFPQLHKLLEKQQEEESELILASPPPGSL